MRIILLIFLIVTVTFSQEKSDAIKTYTLEECLKIANANNPDIKLSVARMSPAAADITNAFGEYLPNLGINMSYRRTFQSQNFSTGDIPDSLILPNQYTSIKPNFYTFNAGFQYTLFAFSFLSF